MAILNLQCQTYFYSNPFQVTVRCKKKHLYFFTGNNVFYTDGDGQVHVGPLPSSDVKQLKGIYFHTQHNAILEYIDISLIIQQCSTVLYLIWPRNHTSHKKIYFNEFVANVLPDVIGIFIFDLRGHGGCQRPKTPRRGRKWHEGVNLLKKVFTEVVW